MRKLLDPRSRTGLTATITFQIKAELWLAGEWSRDTEIIITSAVGPTLRSAANIVALFYPAYLVRGVAIGPIE